MPMDHTVHIDEPHMISNIAKYQDLSARASLVSANRLP